MASVGVEFDQPSLDRIFKQSVEYYQGLQKPSTEDASKTKTKKLLEWAIDPIFKNNHPVRPWSLGQINTKTSVIYSLIGSAARTPGLYKQTDPQKDKNRGSGKFLQDTNERIHSSVRVRLACKGLGLNDRDIWTCPALGPWRLERTTNKYEDPVPVHPPWEPSGDESAFIEHPQESSSGRWVWQYKGHHRNAPPSEKQMTMVEEPLGPYERYLLKLAGGEPNVWIFADKSEGHQE